MRLGFAGTGWIGRHRLRAIAESGLAEIAAIADPSPAMREAAAEDAPSARVLDSFEQLLDLELDGVVIATPSALHAAQAIAALDRGLAVFCQKPVGRTVAETRQVVEAARRADRLLAVDLSYRETRAMRRVRELVAGGELGRIYAVDLVFHNAYGPDKSWFYDRALSGGGCLMDLGIHLVDLALWVLGFPRVDRADARLLCRGEPLGRGGDAVEDFAAAQLDLGGAVARLSCSWRLPAGRDAAIEAAFYGTRGAAAMRNVNGSFYDFVAERYDGTKATVVVEPPDPWGGRVAVQWAERLAGGMRFDRGCEELVALAGTIDMLYRAGMGEE